MRCCRFAIRRFVAAQIPSSQRPLSIMSIWSACLFASSTALKKHAPGKDVREDFFPSVSLIGESFKNERASQQPTLQVKAPGPASD